MSASCSPWVWYNLTFLQCHIRFFHFNNHFILKQQQRRLDLITICDPELKQPAPEGAKRRKLVTITARVHPGETPSSYVCQGRFISH
jgi:hypothetical protein